MAEDLREFRCPNCPPMIGGALLFKAAGNAVVETKCPRCKSIVRAEVSDAAQVVEEYKQELKK